MNCVVIPKIPQLTRMGSFWFWWNLQWILLFFSRGSKYVIFPSAWLRHKCPKYTHAIHFLKALDVSYRDVRSLFPYFNCEILTYFHLYVILDHRDPVLTQHWRKLLKTIGFHPRSVACAAHPVVLSGTVDFYISLAVSPRHACDWKGADFLHWAIWEAPLKSRFWK